MSWKQKTTSGKDFGELPPAGSHAAVLIGLIDLGTQSESFQGGPVEWRRKVMLVWELTDQKMSGTEDRNHVIANRYTFSLSTKATLRKLLENWRGKQFGNDEEVDISVVLGKPCLLNVTHSQSGDRTYANVAGVQPVPKNYPVPPPQREHVSWEVGDDLADLPDWLPYLYGEPVADVVKRSKELSGGDNGQQPATPSGTFMGQQHTTEIVPF
jgi:hypothetical protein